MAVAYVYYKCGGIAVWLRSVLVLKKTNGRGGGLSGNDDRRMAISISRYADDLTRIQFNCPQ